MSNWSDNSLQVRASLDPRLKVMVDELLTYMDVSLICGHRTPQQQAAYFAAGTSKVEWPNSKHNMYPSLAVDMQPYPYPDNENDLRAALGYMAGLCWMIAEREGFSIRWGGDWNRNGSVTDNGFDDLFHLEIFYEEVVPSVAPSSR